MDVKKISLEPIEEGAEKDRKEKLAFPEAEKEFLHDEDVHHDNVSSVEEVVVDDEEPTPWSKRAREELKRHLSRFKWYYLAGLVALLLVILLPVLFGAIIPRIIKNVVDNQALPIISGATVFTGSDSMSIALNTALDTPVGVVIDPVDLALHAPQPEGSDDNELPFLTVHMPKQYVDGKTDVEIPAQTATIQDDTQLVAWFNDFFDSETTQLRVRTDNLVANVGRLSYTVSMDRTIRVQGLNSLQGFSLPSMNLILPAEANGTNVAGTLIIPNAGVLTLSMGNVTFNLWAGNLDIGTVTAYDLTLKPGNNTAPFQGQLDTDLLIKNLDAILDSQSEAVSNGYIELNATGNSTFYNGNRITYIENVLNTKKLLVQFPVSTLVSELEAGELVTSSDSSSDSGSGGSDSSDSSSLLNDLGNALSNLTLLQTTPNDAEEEDSVLDDVKTVTSGSIGGSLGRARRAMVTKIAKGHKRLARKSLFGLETQDTKGEE
ncbi:Protein of unknown function (DUF3712) domain containing protein [Naviculisporaceae sp. PSN 640]